MRKFLAVMVLFTLAFASYGCGDSGGSEVYATNNGATGGGTGNVPARVADVDVRVVVGQAFPGAQQVAALEVDRTTALLQLFSSPAYAQTTGFTLPGATVAAFGPSGDAVATSTVDARGIARFDDLPVGTYRFVVSNGGRVLLITVATAGQNLNANADELTTAAALVTIRRGFGSTDQETFDSILETGTTVPQFNALLVQLRAAQAGTTPFVSDNGLAVQNTSLSNAVVAANEAIPATPGQPAGGTGGGTNTTGSGGASSSGGNTNTNSTGTGTSTSTGTSTNTGTTTGTATNGTSSTTGTSGIGTTGTGGTITNGTSSTTGTSGIGTTGTGGTSTNGTSGTAGTSGSGTSGTAGTSGTVGTSGAGSTT